MKQGINTPIVRALVLTALVSLCTTACGGPKAEGHIYAGGGNIVKIEFKPDGKAFMAMGPMSMPCTYSQSGQTVTLTCDGETTEFKIDDDGALIGPPDGMLARLTQEK